jgi:hypothetical protein
LLAVGGDFVGAELGEVCHFPVCPYYEGILFSGESQDGANYLSIGSCPPLQCVENVGTSVNRC